MNTHMNTQNMERTCDYWEGMLPGQCAPLASAYVPFQTDADKVYSSEDALQRGTLFPGLDLPFMDYVSSGAAPNTPMAELMALGFAAHELGLYLDTHPTDTEAFALFQEYVRLFKEGRQKYIRLYGPLSQFDTAELGRFSWLDDPWPWNAGGSGS